MGSEVDDGGFIQPPMLDVAMGSSSTTSGGGGGESGGIGSASGGSASGGDVEIPPDACVPLDLLDERRSLIETNLDVLSSISLRRTFHRIASNGDLLPDPNTTHDLLIDHSNDSASAHFGSTSSGHCDDELVDGEPSFNGFPLQCPRAEGAQIGNLDQWQLIAAVNRLDLAPADGSHCGEQRLIFANNAQSRMFIIFEAQIPNPDPSCGVAACRPIADFWAQQSDIEDVDERSVRLRGAFFGNELSDAGFPPFMVAQHMTFGTGQVRTNNFDQFPWDLKEFKLIEGPGDRLIPTQVTVSSNVFGPLLDDSFDHPLGPMCREAFIDAIDGLVTDDVNLMGLDMPAACLAGESLDEFDNLYDFQIGLGSQAFRDAIEQRAIDLGASLTAEEVGARAGFAGSCIGCHQQQVGVNLGNGVVSPFSSGFVHVDEQFTENCGEGGGECFSVSPALADVFLPFRHQVMLDVLAECPDVCDVAPPVMAPQMPRADLGIAALLQLEEQARGPSGGVTIGGRPLAAVH